MNTMDSVKVGASVLETLTTGMYVDPFDALREYLQNSADSIRRALEAGLLPSIDCGRIEVKLDTALRRLVIRDNGTGIRADEMERKILNVGLSEKMANSSAGFRGIGRLAGLAYCSSLLFRSLAPGEKMVSQVHFDALKLRERLIPSNARLLSLQEVLQEVCRYSTEEKKTNKRNEGTNPERFFEVVLEGIDAGGDCFLDAKAVKAYLRQAAPVGLDVGSFSFGNRINSWAAEQGLTPVEIVTILEIDGSEQQQVFRPYDKITYKTGKEIPVRISDIAFIPSDKQKDRGYWGWFGVSDTPGIIEDEAAAGIRIRMNNIAIGPRSDRMDEIFGKSAPSNSRFNRYLVGEIHVTNPDIIPNARRDGFEPTAAWLEIERQLIEFAKERSREVRANSETRNASLDKLLKPCQKLLSKVSERAKAGVVDEEEREDFLRRIEAEKEKLEEASRGQRKEEEKERLSGIRSELEVAKTSIEAAPFRAARLKSDLNRRQRGIIEEILKVLKAALREEAYFDAEKAIMQRFGNNEGDL